MPPAPTWLLDFHRKCPLSLLRGHDLRGLTHQFTDGLAGRLRCFYSGEDNGLGGYRTTARLPQCRQHASPRAVSIAWYEATDTLRSSTAFANSSSCAGLSASRRLMIRLKCSVLIARLLVWIEYGQNQHATRAEHTRMNPNLSRTDAAEETKRQEASAYAKASGG